MFDWFTKQAAQAPEAASSPIVLYNTLGAARMPLAQPRGTPIRMYNCGPTVYDRQQIGNLAMFVFADTLRKLFEYNGLDVKQVINITDVGHLTSDADEGDDKMVSGLKREGMTPTLQNMRVLAERYTSMFLDDLRRLNIPVDKIQFPRASDHIQAQIAMIDTLLEKGYAYEGTRGVYYDVARFPEYGVLGNVQIEALKAGARIAVNPEKRHPADFTLWKKDEKIGWESPWGKGFPGWHIECSAMARAILGEQIDVHTGGPEHIAVHHNNEIAQSEAATGKKPFSRFWLHRAWIQIEGTKISKSLGNTVYLSDIIERDYDPLSYRYLLLGAHYRTQMNFTWESLAAAETAHLRLRRIRDSIAGGTGSVSTTYRARFQERVNDDLDTPGAIALMWEMLRDDSLLPADAYATLIDMDRVFGLNLSRENPALRVKYELAEGVLVPDAELPDDVREKIQERDEARATKQWARADEIRDDLQKAGYRIEDGARGTSIYKTGT